VNTFCGISKSQRRISPQRLKLIYRILKLCQISKCLQLKSMPLNISTSLSERCLLITCNFSTCSDYLIAIYKKDVREKL
jgi:hypothetical protein